MFSSFSRCHKTCCGDKVYCCDRSDVSRVCHGASVTRHKGAWQCHNLPTLYGTTGPFISLLMGISHNISSPQLLHSSSTLPCHERLNITQPLPIQVKESNGHPTVGVHVLGSMKSQLRHRRHKIVTIPQPLGPSAGPVCVSVSDDDVISASPPVTADHSACN